MVHEVASVDELQAELQNEKNKGKLIVLDFFATYVDIFSNFIRIYFRSISWCGPCVRIAPKIDDWSKGDYKDRVIFLKCDVDKAEAVSQEYNIEAMPTFVFFKDGKEIHRIVGANVDQLKADIESKSK